MENFSNTDYNHRPRRPLSSPAVSTQSISADIVFGSPRDDCGGTGICKIEAHCLQPAAAAPPRECRRAPAGLTAPDPYFVSITFRRTDLCSHLFSQYFRKENFDLPQGCPLPPELAQALQLNGDELRPGTYPIEHFDGFLRITLNV